MKNKEKFENKEDREQTPEEIKNVLVEAICAGGEVDLIINGQSVSRMIIERIYKNDKIAVSYINNDKQLGELITVDLSDITKAKISEE